MPPLSGETYVSDRERKCQLTDSARTDEPGQGLHILLRRVWSAGRPVGRVEHGDGPDADTPVAPRSQERATRRDAGGVDRPGAPPRLDDRRRVVDLSLHGVRRVATVAPDGAGCT